jgi:hypothetical protein
VTDTRGTALARPGSFEQVLFTAVGGGDELSDHCPIAVVFEPDGAVVVSDPITDLLNRLDAVQAELQAIRDISRNRSASLLFSTSWQRAILSSVIVVVSGPGLRVATQPYRRSRGDRPLWIAGLPPPDS